MSADNTSGSDDCEECKKLNKQIAEETNANKLATLQLALTYHQVNKH